ncbi:MAG: tetratricopeptide repeat protein [Theionarchaea archaeon]|nr:tetratricopeptide repeat protein [Theionarchaea archaeon]MBU7036831.1 tetratricopeptide repeat protein [Theionarchaea archaeon]
MRDEHYSEFYLEFGWVLEDMSFLKEAVEYYEKALAIDREVYGEKHPSVATRLNNLGSAWKSLGDSRKMVECFEKAHRTFHEILGPDHPYTLSTKRSLHYLKHSSSSNQE